MPVQMICPNSRCGRIHSFPDEARGQVIKCLRCEQQFRIPCRRLTPRKKVTAPEELFKVPAAPFVF